MRAEQSRADNIDVLKAVCAFLVVCIHAPFPGVVGEYFTPLTRVAVPIFFMITGFFYDNTIKNNCELKQLNKILIMLVKGNLLFFVWNVFKALLQGNLKVYLSQTFNMQSFLKFALLNASPFSGHLWYLGAILYVLIIMYIADKVNISKLNVITPFLLIGDLALGKYSLLLFNVKIPYILVRNFLFVGIPYFCLGGIIKKAYLHGNIIKIKKPILELLMVLFAFTTLLEKFLLVQFGMNAARDHYISTTLSAVAVFLFTLKCNGHNKMMANLGKNYSTWIYILHPIFIDIIRFITSNVGIQHVYSYMEPFVVYLITTAFLVCVTKLNRKSVL